MLLHCNTNQNTLRFDRSLNTKFISESSSLSKESIHTKLNQYISKGQLAILIGAFLVLLFVAMASAFALLFTSARIADKENQRSITAPVICTIIALILLGVVSWYIMEFNTRANDANSEKADELFAKKTTEADLRIYTQFMLMHTLTPKILEYATRVVLAIVGIVAILALLQNLNIIGPNAKK